MTQPPPYSAEDSLHREIQELLPWYVNGTLRDAEAASVDAHLAKCRDCRALPAAVKEADENTWSPAATHFTDLMQRIDAAEALRAQPQGLVARAKHRFAWWG